MMKQALPGDALRISADEWNEIRRRVLGDNLTNNRRPVPTEVLYGRAGGSGIPSRTVAQSISTIEMQPLAI